MGSGSRGNMKQRAKRYRRRLGVRFWSDDFEGAGFSVDISGSGMLIETSRVLDVGTRIHLEIRLGEGSYFAEAVVARTKVYPRSARSVFKPCMGLRFVSLGEVLKAMSGDTPRTPLEAVPQVRRDASTLERLEVDERDDLSLEVDLRDRVELEAVYERDIKHGGLLVPTREPPDLNTEVVAHVVLPEPNGSIECRGTVVRIQDEPPAIALRLAEVDEVRARLAEIIRAR